MELTLSLIDGAHDTLQRSYWTFIYKYVRASVWEEMFKEHLDKYYPKNPRWVTFKPSGLSVVLPLTAAGFYKIDDGPLKGQYRALDNVTIDISQLVKVKSRTDDLRIGETTVLREISSARNNKRTNFPRATWQKDELSWQVYYEALIIISRIYKHLSIRFDLVYRDKEIHQYTIPVNWSLLEMPDGADIKHTGRVSDALVVSSKLDRQYESPLTHIVRELFVRHNLTRKELDNLLDVFVANPNNLYSFHSDSKPNIKSSILGTMYKWNMAWANFTRTLAVLGYTDLHLSIVAQKRPQRMKSISSEEVISTTNLRLV